MTLNASGPISLAGSVTGESIAVELGVSSTGTISLNDSNVRTLAGVASGVIVMPTDFWGKSSSLPFTVYNYTTAGTYTFTVPTGVTEINCVCIGGGGGGSWSNIPNPGFSFRIPTGGALSYSNAIPTTPGENLTVVVGAGGLGPTNTPSQATDGGSSYLARGATNLVFAQNGFAVPSTAGGSGNGGQASAGVGSVRYSGGGGSGSYGIGGGSAAGWSANGVNGSSSTAPAANGQGGSGGAGCGSGNQAGLGGGTGNAVAGANGAGGATTGASGTAGSGGTGQLYGGGGSGHGDANTWGASGRGGGVGAVRIIYGGTGKTYPNNSV